MDNNYNNQNPMNNDPWNNQQGAQQDYSQQQYQQPDYTQQYQEPYNQQPYNQQYQNNQQYPNYNRQYPDYNQQYSDYNGQYPMYEQPNQGGKGMAVASLVLGIVSFLCCGLPCSIVGLILGIISKKRQPMNNGMATAGIVLCIIGLVFTVISLIVIYTTDAYTSLINEML